MKLQQQISAPAEYTPAAINKFAKPGNKSCAAGIVKRNGCFFLLQRSSAQTRRDTGIICAGMRVLLSPGRKKFNNA
jgi:hypothetical protein